VIWKSGWMTSECQAQPDAWSDWGGFVDTHDQNGDNDTHGSQMIRKENRKWEIDRDNYMNEIN
jgi:hypothetical protein